MVIPRACAVIEKKSVNFLSYTMSYFIANLAKFAVVFYIVK